MLLRGLQAGEEVALYFDGSDTLTLPENTSTRDRWILQYSGLAAYPWVESGVSRTNNELGVRVHKDGDIIDLERQINLSEAERNNSRIETMAAISDDQTITFTPDEVKFSVTIQPRYWTG